MVIDREHGAARRGIGFVATIFALAMLYSLPISSVQALQPEADSSGAADSGRRAMDQDEVHFKGIFSSEAIAPSRSAIPRIGDFSNPVMRSDTEVSLRKGYAEYRIRGLVQFLDQAPGDMEAKQKLASFVRSVHLESDGMPRELSDRTMYELAREYSEPNAIENQDPMILVASAYHLAGYGEMDRVRACSEAAIRKLRKSEYPSQCALQAFTAYVKNQHSFELPLQGEFSAEDYVECFYYWIKHDLQLQPDDFPFVGYTIWDFVNTYHSLDPKQCDSLIGVIRASTEIPEYFRLLFEGFVRSAQASKARGTEFVSSVSEENLRIFEDRSEQAISCFERAWDLNPSWVVPAMMLHHMNFKLGDREAGERWFELGIQAQYDDWDLRTNHIWYQMPRWGGSIEKMMDYGLRCYDEGRFDTRVPFILIETTLKAQREKPSQAAQAILAKYDGLAPKCLDCIDRLTENYALLQAKFHPRWYQTVKAIVADLLGENAAARAAMDALDNKYADEVLTDWHPLSLNWAQFKTLVYAKSGPTGDLTQEFLEISGTNIGQPDPYRARVGPMIDEALSKAEHPLEKKFWDRQRMVFDWQFDYRDGKRVDLGFQQELTIWTATGNCGFDLRPDGVKIDALTFGTRAFDLSTPALFPGAKIIDFDYEVLETKEVRVGPGDNIYNRHLAIVSLDAEADKLSVGINSVLNQLVMTLGPGNPIYQYQLPATKQDHRYHVRLYFGRKYLEVHVNGQLVSRIRHDSIRPTNQISFTNSPFFNGRGIFLFQNISVQKWLEGVPPDESDVKGLFDYYKKATVQRSDDGWLWFNLGVAAHQLDRFDEATGDFSKAIELGLPPDFINFYTGDIQERKGEIAKAFESYRQSACSQQWFVCDIDSFPRSFVSPRDWAAFRCRWLLATMDPTPEVSADDLRTIHSVKLVPPAPWMLQLLDACEAAHEGNFDDAQMKSKAALSQAPAEDRDLISRQIASYAENRKFVFDPAEHAFYLGQGVKMYWHIADDQVKREMLRLMRKQ